VGNNVKDDDGGKNDDDGFNECGMWWCFKIVYFSD